MPRLQATVPPHAVAGTVLRVRCPDGTEVNVTVPKGMSAGDDFIFELPSLGDIPGDQSSGGQQDGSGGGGGKGGARKRSGAGSSNKNRSKQQQQHPNASPDGVSPVSLGFLDREIVSGKDFATALAVGMFIGVCIVLGFVAGVLLVTDP